MTLRHLKIFVAVCENGGITRAAEALHIVQPSVSYTISEMEKYYKVALFDRINQRLVLTETGHRLLIKAKEILAEFDDFETLAAEGTQKSALKIGSSLTLGKTVIPKYLDYFKKNFKEIIPTVKINSTSVIEKDLEKGLLDFGIVEGEIYSPYLQIYEFGYDEIIAVAKYDYDIKNTISLEELTKYPLMLREDGSASRNRLERALSENGLSVTPFIESVSNQCILTFLYSGFGISVLPEGIVNPLIEKKILKKIKIEGVTLRRNHSLAIHKNKKLNSLQKKAFEIFKSQALL